MNKIFPELSLKDELAVHCYLYYILCNPYIADGEFDALEREYCIKRNLHDEFGDLDGLCEYRSKEIASAYPIWVLDFCAERLNLR